MAAITSIYEITRVNPTLFIVTIRDIYQLMNETTNNWVLIKIIKLLTEFYQVEPRLKQKLQVKFQGLLESQKAKSVQFEVLKAVLKIFEKEDELYVVAIKMLQKDYLDQSDPNLRYLGLQTLENFIEIDTELAVKLIKMFEYERESSIIDKLVELMKSIINETNFKQILLSLFEKFKKQQNLLAIETLLEIHDTTDIEPTLFQKFYILYVLVPLLDLYSSQSKKLS